VETDCDHEWKPLEFEDGENSKASVCSKCGALRSGQGSIVITANYIDFSPLTSNPTLAEGRQWFRSDFDAMYWSPDGSVIERMKAVPPTIASGSLTGIKGFEYLVEGDPTDSWLFTMNPSAGVWIKQYSTGASFNAQMVYHGAYQHWTGDNTFVDVPNKADNVYGAGEEATVHQIPDGTEVGRFAATGTDARGIAWDGEYLWQSDHTAAVIYKLKTDGTKVGTIPSPAPGPNGLSWDGTYLWNADDACNFVYQIDTAGAIVSRFSAPAPNSRGVAWDGEYLWFSSSSADTIYKVTSGGTVKSTNPTPYAYPQCLSWDGEYLWNAHRASGLIYQLNTAITVKGSFSPPGVGPFGEGWDGEYLWDVDYDAVAVYRLGAAGSFDLDYKIAPA